MSRTRLQLLTAIALVVQIALAGCGGGKDDRLKTLAGTYAREETSEEKGTRLYERTVLTLRTDNRWTMLREATVNGEPWVSSTDSGTFSFKDVTLVTNSPRAGVFTYTLNGDTLWMNAAEHVALTQAVTGIDMSSGGAGGRGYLLRQP